jgi:hypothetical protein
MLNPLCLQYLQVTTDELKTRVRGPHLHDHGTVGQVEKLRVLQVPQTAKSLNGPIRTQTPPTRPVLTTFAILVHACSPVRTWVVRLLAMSGNLVKPVELSVSQHLSRRLGLGLMSTNFWAIALRNRINRIRGAWLRLERPVLYSLEWRIACQATQPTEAAASLMGDKRGFELGEEIPGRAASDPASGSFMRAIMCIESKG